MSIPDLFHLFLLLSPPPPGVTYFPWCIYPCVSCLSVPVRCVCQSSQPVCFSHTPFDILFLIVLHGFDPCLTLDYFPACLIILPALTFNLPALQYLFGTYTTILLPTPFWINKHCKTPIICIWVSPCASISLFISVKNVEILVDQTFLNALQFMQASFSMLSTAPLVSNYHVAQKLFALIQQQLVMCWHIAIRNVTQHTICLSPYTTHNSM